MYKIVLLGVIKAVKIFNIESHRQICIKILILRENKCWNNNVLAKMTVTSVNHCSYKSIKISHI